MLRSSYVRILTGWSYFQAERRYPNTLTRLWSNNCSLSRDITGKQKKHALSCTEGRTAWRGHGFRLFSINGPDNVRIRVLALCLPRLNATVMFKMCQFLYSCLRLALSLCRRIKRGGTCAIAPCCKSFSVMPR